MVSAIAKAGRKIRSRLGSRRFGGIVRREAQCPPFKILVGMHHKTGSSWMHGIFSKLCGSFQWVFYDGEQASLPGRYEVFFNNHSRFILQEIREPCRGLHMIRDPRDRIVSGCFYHQKSSEEWLHVKQPEFGGLTYQEKINSYGSLDDQLLFEMEHAGRRGIQEMLLWDYSRPEFYEIKYEELIFDHDLRRFHDVFAFLGIPGEILPDSLRIAYDNSLFSGKHRKSPHIRSGQPGQWVTYFNRRHRERFLELFGDALLTLGYESDHQWVTDEPAGERSGRGS